MSRMPKPYVNEVPTDVGKTPGIVHVPLHNMDIGARKGPGMPEKSSEGPAPIVHVGGSAGSKG